MSRWTRGRAVFHRAGPPRATICWQPLAILIPLLLFLPGLSGAGVAQLVEHLICNQRVGGSIPSASSTSNCCRGARAERILREKTNGLVSFDTSPFCVFAQHASKLLKTRSGPVVCVPKVFTGRVGEWLKPADCKSAAPCGLRRFESFPVHHYLVVGLEKTAGQSHPAMFERGPIRGTSAAADHVRRQGRISIGTWIRPG